MATPAQVEANRLNAQRSTGPRTADGKAVASRNSTKWGLFSRHVLLPCEDEAAFAEFREGLFARLKPADALEQLYAERIVATAWRLRRALEGEAALYAQWRRDAGFVHAAEVLAEQAPMQDLERLQKHIASLERSMDKAQETLGALQERRAEEADDPNPQNEPNAQSEDGKSARVEIVKTNPIALGQTRKEAEERSNSQNEPNGGNNWGVQEVQPKPAIGSGGGAFPAPTPGVTSD